MNCVQSEFDRIKKKLLETPSDGVEDDDDDVWDDRAIFFATGAAFASGALCKCDTYEKFRSMARAIALEARHIIKEIGDKESDLVEDNDEPNSD